MTQLNSTSLREIFQEALKEDKDFIKELLRRLLQEFMEEERDQQVGVSSYVRDKSIRKATRNGYKSRSLNTRVANLKLKKLQEEEFSGTPHQRCMVHWERNLLFNNLFIETTFSKYFLGNETEITGVLLFFSEMFILTTFPPQTSRPLLLTIVTLSPVEGRG
ncbi:MAG TPA: hypothetical protein DHW70_04690 [Candidatus Atribacteria bacterium]|nr:hypothetical protein [Candidatus Atribacteria bacterium]